MACVEVLDRRYGEFSAHVHEYARLSRSPIVGSFEVTARCNLKCVHCYINLPAGDLSARKRELSCSEICSILDQIADEGCLWLTFTGGEVLMRKDFLEIYTHAKGRGILPAIYTNGTLITEQIADYLSEWRPFVVEISLYGMSRTTYETVTQVKGSYDRCMEAIDLLYARHVPLKLKAVALTSNVHELQAMKDFAEDLGVDFRFDPMINPRIDGSRQPTSYRLLPEQVVSLDWGDERRRGSWREFFDRQWGRVPVSQGRYLCGAGISAFHIDSYGRLSLCLLARNPQYDLREGTFREGWQFLREVRELPVSHAMPCGACQLRPVCDQCPGWSQVEFGDDETPVEFVCQVTHLRARMFAPDRRESVGA